MKAPILIFPFAVLLLAGCGKQSAANNAPGQNPLNAPADYVGALAKGRESAIKVTDVASLNQAIQMFNVNEGRYPKDLNELLQSGLIVKIPDAPYGMKLNYDAASGQISVVKTNQP
jgi:hypothetical protein